MVRLPDDRVDTSRLAETEDSKVLGTKWWTLGELERTGERIEPAGLVGLAKRIVGDDPPASPVNLSWHRARA